MDSPTIELWFWIVTDEITKRRRQTRHKMTEQEARQRHGVDALRVEHSLEIRHTGRDWHTSRFQQSCRPPAASGHLPAGFFPAAGFSSCGQ
jgi:hypothetical protein